MDSLWHSGRKEVFFEGVGLEKRTKASIKVLVSENAVIALSSLVTCVEIAWTPSGIVGVIEKVPTMREIRKNIACSIILGTVEGFQRIRDAPSIL
jgi:hypothetical protein